MLTVPLRAASGRLRRLARGAVRLAGGTGPRGERAAVRALRRAGYRVLARNASIPGGEIDLVALSPDRSTFVVVEVKTRQRAGARPSPRPEARVGPQKQRRISRLAARLARRYRLTDRPLRFDVVGVDLAGERVDDVRHHPGAFTTRV